MQNANRILESLDAAEIRQRIEDLDKEKQALLILHRAALRLEHQGNAVEQPSTMVKGGG